MENNLLKKVDPENLEDLLAQLEITLNIKFETSDFNDIHTFGQLSDLIIGKIELENYTDCTSQQAFYKLRMALAKEFMLNPNSITPNTLWSDILPRKKRYTVIAKLDSDLGIRLGVLTPPDWVIIVLLCILGASLIGIFMNWKIGLSGILLASFGFWLTDKFGNEIELKTVGEAAKKMTHEHYFKVRRNPTTVNKKEIESLIIDWFTEEFGIERSNLTREASLR